MILLKGAIPQEETVGMNKKLRFALVNFDIGISGITMAALILFTFIAVIMRYVVGRSIIWGEEFQTACLVIVVFFGGSAGFRMGGHVVIDFVVDMMPKKIQGVFEKAIYGFSVLVLLYFLYYGVVYVRQMAVTNRLTNILHIPYAVLYAAFPISCALMIINYTASVWEKISGKEGAQK
jgi:TRAP-type C4-dicarboxylate transport system permease small subunit